MSIGNKIYELRTARNLSQSDLADVLDVSRQSVSKWETDTAVPDLDKLVKLCDVFGVTLDELTGRETPETKTLSSDPKQKAAFSAQKIIGYILFAFSLLFGFFIMLFGTNKGDFIILLPFAVALLVCGLLCLFAGNKAFYWCIWTVLAPITVLTPHLVMLSALSTLTGVLLVIAVVMLFVANAVFRDVVIKTNKKKSRLLILGWLLPVLLYVAHMFLSLLDMQNSVISYSWGLSFLLNFLCYGLIAGLETYTVCYIRNLKKKASL